MCTCPNSSAGAVCTLFDNLCVCMDLEIYPPILYYCPDVVSESQYTKNSENSVIHLLITLM